MIRKFFFGSILLALLINLFGDYAVYQQSQIITDTGKWVHRSYEVLQNIDAVKTSILESQIHQKLEPKVQIAIQKLTEVVNGQALQQERVLKLNNLSSHQLLNSQNNLPLIVLSEMSTAEQALLNERLVHDQKNNSISVDRILLADLMDLVLIFMCLGLYLSEKRAAARLQKVLTTTLAHVEAVNQNLQVGIAKKEIIFRTTVHDLKNPLGSIRGFAELLFDEAENKASVLEMSKIIQRVSNDTLNLVSSVLEKAKTRENENNNENETIHLVHCLKEICQFMEPVARNKNQTICLNLIHSDFHFYASQIQIQDIFYNVIGNALKFSPHGTVVTVKCKQNRDYFEIQVMDEGPGFSEEDFTYLFEPGKVLSAKPTGNEISTGLGLFSVKQTLEHIHGTLDVVNNQNGGACVKIGLPCIELKSQNNTIN